MILRKILGRFLILGKSKANIWHSTNLKLGNNNAIIIVKLTLLFLRPGGRYYVTLLLNRELDGRVKLSG